jgi:electron transfer flavoprotein alpha subunit
MKAIVFAEHNDIALQLVSAARATGANTVVQVAFNAVPEVSAADVVAVLNVSDGQAYENAAASIASWFDGQAAGAVFAEPTRRLKAIVGYLAAKNGVAAVGNITTLNDAKASSLYFGGLAIKDLVVTAKLAIYYIGEGVFEPAAASAPATEQIPWIEPAVGISVISRSAITRGTTDLSKSEIIVSCGRGFAEEASLDLARELADKTGAGLGCTRPLTEAVNWFAKETYIGISGAVLAPRVYIGIGVSGQMQHMVGVAKAKTIIVINKDKDAPAFKQADIGIVGDLHQVLPQLLEAL